MIETRDDEMPTKTRTPNEAASERKLDDLINEHAAQNDAAYAPVYVPSEMPEPSDTFLDAILANQDARDAAGADVTTKTGPDGKVTTTVKLNGETYVLNEQQMAEASERLLSLPGLADMTQQADLPPSTVYGVNEELGGDLEYDVDAEGRVQNPRRQPPAAKGDEPDLGPLTLEAYWEKARKALDLRDIALSDKARATSSKKAYDDAAKIVDQLGRQIREFGGFGAAKAEKAPTLFEQGRVSDAEYEAFMDEPRPEPESAGE